MSVYIVLILVVGLFALLLTSPTTGRLYRNQNLCNRVFFLLVVVFIIIQGFRTNLVGGDLINYGYRFSEFGGMSWREILNYNAKYELGYIVLNKLVYMISNGNFQALLIVIAVFYNFSLAFFLRKHSSNYMFSLYLYVALNIFNLSMNNLRSTVALGVFYIGLPFLFQRKYIKFLITLYIATLFHTSMWCMLFLFAAVLIKNKYVFGTVCLGVVGFLGVGFKFFSRIIMAAFPKYLSYFMEDTSGGGLNLFMFLIFLLAAVLVLAPREWWQQDEKVILLKMFICGICLQIVSLNVSFFARAVYYHLIAVLILYPELIHSGKISRRSSIIFMAIIMACFFGYYYVALLGNSTMTVPYEWIFS